MRTEPVKFDLAAVDSRVTLTETFTVAPSDTNHRKGLLITAIGGLALTVDIPLIRLADGDPWPILMLRTGTTFLAALVIWAVWRALSPNAPSLVPGRLGAVVAVLYGLGSITFITAVYNTSTANLVFILAFTTMFAALLSWIFLKERPRPVTLVTMAVMIVGVLIIVVRRHRHGQHLWRFLRAVLGAADRLGDHGKPRTAARDMGFTALIGVIFPFAIAAIVVAEDRLPRRPAMVDHLQRRGGHADLVLLPRHRPEISVGAGGRDVLSARNRARAGLGVADLFRGAIAQRADRRHHPDRRAGRPFAVAARRWPPAQGGNGSAAPGIAERGSEGGDRAWIA